MMLERRALFGFFGAALTLRERRDVEVHSGGGGARTLDALFARGARLKGPACRASIG